MNREPKSLSAHKLKLQRHSVSTRWDFVQFLSAQVGSGLCMQCCWKSKRRRWSHSERTKHLCDILATMVLPFHTQKWKVVNIKKPGKKGGKGQTQRAEGIGCPCPAHHLLSVCVTQSCLCRESPGQKMNSSFVAHIASATSHSYMKRFRPSTSSFKDHLWWHFKNGSRAGGGLHPPRRQTMMQCELNTRWPVRGMSAQTPFECWSTSHSPDWAPSWGSSSDLSAA